MTETAKHKRLAENTIQLFNKHNKETTFKKSIHDKSKRLWILPVEKYDDNASKFANNKAKEVKVSELKKRKLKPVKEPVKSKAITQKKVRRKQYSKNSNSPYLKVVELHKQKLMNVEIASQLNIPVGSVSYHLQMYRKENNLSVIKKRAKVQERIAEIIKCYENGELVKDIAVKFNISETTASRNITDRLKELGTDKRELLSQKENICFDNFKKLKTNKYISDTFNIHKNTVSYHRMKFNKINSENVVN